MDTDIGGDPDDFVTLLLVSWLVKDLLVITADEVAGLRAELARRVLRQVGRDDVEVIEGTDLGNRKYFLPDPGQRVPDYVEPSPQQAQRRRRDLVEAIHARIEATPGAVRWVGCGPMTNLAYLLEAYPELADRITVWQMGGWLDHYRKPTAAEHNLRTDPRAAGVVLRMMPDVRLVLADHTNNDAIRVTEDWPLIKAAESEGAPDWAQLFAAHFRRWIARGYDGFWLHDPGTLAAGLRHRCVTFTSTPVRIGADARLYRDPDGRTLTVSTHIDYGALVDWVHEGVVRW